MSGDRTVTINDKGAFPGKIADIEKAVTQLRAFAESLPGIVSKARVEAASFTTSGEPAAIYDPALNALTAWADAVKQAITSVCDSADSCVQTASRKFHGIVEVDTTGSEKIKAS